MGTETVRLEQVATFERLRPQLRRLCEEVKELSKKKADATLSKFKVALINEKLAEANSLLTGKFKPFKDFDLFELDGLPTSSDAVIIMSQYLEGLETWRSSRVVYDGEAHQWYWNISERDVAVETSSPKRAQIVEVGTPEENEDDDSEDGDKEEEEE